MDIPQALTSKDDSASCEFMETIVLQSETSNTWYGSFADVATLLTHPKSLVRNRALCILASLAKWDTHNLFDSVIGDFLSLITDPKPITARQCIKALCVVAKAKPQYIPRMVHALQSADLSLYKDTMRPLLQKDIASAIESLQIDCRLYTETAQSSRFVRKKCFVYGKTKKTH